MRQIRQIECMTEESLIKYPCDFPIKIMGKAEQDFTRITLAIVKRHAPDFDETTIEMRSSKGGNYLSITCTVRATSRDQLDALYRALTDHPMISVVL
jgi:putative lipoic acid-binding regulatory protein